MGGRTARKVRKRENIFTQRKYYSFGIHGSMALTNA